jgi:hypothetical protein
MELDPWKMEKGHALSRLTFQSASLSYLDYSHGAKALTRYEERPLEKGLIRGH